jgi:CheY-like chemotaxis protein
MDGSYGCPAGDLIMKKILVVDDHAPVLRVLKLGMEDAGYEVDTALNGSECLLKLCDEQPDFLVTDIDMPRMGGKELCLAIEEQIPERVFPIVVLTSRTELDHRDWTRNIDNLVFMEKPVSIRRLLSHIDRCFAEAELQERFA